MLEGFSGSRVAIGINPPKSHAVAEAIRKMIAVISGELAPTEESFPNRNERGSPDYMAWLAGLH